jgi:RNA polymerase sigma-70 factor (ECF subfamily)
MCAEWIYDALTRARDGDADAFSALVEEYGPDVLRLCMVITADRSMAEDASQETWRKVWRGLDKLRDRAKLRAWLLRVAANEAKQQLRRARRHAWLSLDSASADKGADDPAEAVGMRMALQSLKVEDRELLAARYALGLTSGEIAQHLGITAEGVRSRLSRLRRALQNEVA